MIATYAPMFLLLVVAVALAVHLLGRRHVPRRHKKPNAEKNAPFECGSESSGGRH